MDQTLSSRAARSKSQQTLTDVAVVIAMGLVAVAISVALAMHFGLPTSRAGIAGVLIFALLVGAHFFLVPRANTTQDVIALEDEELWRALKEQRGNAPDAKRMAMATRGEVVETTPEVDPTQQTASPPQADPSQVTHKPTVAHVPRRKPRILSPAPTADQTLQAHPGAPEEPAPFEAQSDVSDPKSFWSYRPRNDALVTETDAEENAPQEPVLNTPPPVTEPDAGQERSGAEMASKQPNESDVELVQSMIKKLAQEVNAREVLDQTKPPSVESHNATGAADLAATTTEAVDHVLASTPPAVQPPKLPSQGAHETNEPDVAEAPQLSAQNPPSLPQPPSTPAAVDLVTASVGALRTTADAMREADDAAPDNAPQVEQSVHPAMGADAGQVAEAISGALAGGQVGVLLEPIVALNGMRPDHYEVRLQISSPLVVDLEGAGIERDLQATDVLADLDRARFIKTLSVGELLRDRGKAGSLLTRIYRESLLDRDFCFAVATSGVANEELARHMVLTMSQDAVRALTASEWQTISEFHELGYRFAVSHVSDLDMDFAQLTAAGFSFVKLSADAFLGGFLDGEGAITPQELSRYLERAGLSVIVEGLESSVQGAEALAMGVELGQGPVTGGPRLLKADAVTREDHAVA